MSRFGNMVMPGLMLLWMVCFIGGCQSTATSADVAGPSAAAEAAPARALTMDQPVTVALREHRGYLFVQTAIDGRPAGWFMLDTGSSLNIVAKGVAGRLQLPRIEGEHTVTGVGGQDTFSFHRTQWVSFGVWHVPLDRLAALDMHRFSQSVGLSTAGILGFAALSSQPFTLDMPSQRLTLYPRDGFEPPKDATAFRYEVVNRLPYVWAEVGEGRTVLLLLDTGAGQSLVLPDRVLHQWPQLLRVPETGGGVTAGVGGAVRARQSWLRSLNLPGRTLTDVPVSFEPTPPGLDHEQIIIGRVGNQLLQHARLTFDPATQRLWAQWALPSGRQ